MKLLIICALIVSVLPIVNAQYTGGSGDNIQTCQTYNVANIALTVSAGVATVCLNYPSTVAESDSTFWIGMSYHGPIITAIGAHHFEIYSGGSSLVGCTTANTALDVFNFPSTAGSNGIFTVALKMADTECSGLIQVVVSAGAVPVQFVNELLVFDVHAADSAHVNFDVICNATSATPQAFNTAVSTCNPFTESVTNSGTMTLSGSINVANSGTQHLIIDSWPNLISAVTNSGTINVVNSGGQTFTVSGSLALSGALTVTNAGGEAITVTSWPQLQTVLSGAVTIHQDPICTATQHCHIDSNSNTTTILKGNVTNIFSSNLHLCGPVNATNPCTPIDSASTDLGGALTRPLEKLLIDWAPLIIGIALIWLGELRSDFILRIFGGVFIVMAALLCPINNALLGFVLAWVGIFEIGLMALAPLNERLGNGRKFRNGV